MTRRRAFECIDTVCEQTPRSLLSLLSRRHHDATAEQQQQQERCVCRRDSSVQSACVCAGSCSLAFRVPLLRVPLPACLLQCAWWPLASCRALASPLRRPFQAAAPAATNQSQVRSRHNATARQQPGERRELTVSVDRWLWLSVVCAAVPPAEE